MQKMLALGAVGAIATLGMGGTAHAGPDPLKGGSVSWQLRGKNRPHNLALAIAGGDLDPVTGAGQVIVTGKFRSRLGKSKAKVRLVSLNLGANGSPGTITARVKGDRVGRFGILSGGTVTRAGFGATLSNVTASLTKKGAKAIRRGKKGHRRSSGAAAAAKGGRSLGTLSLTTVPQTVEVVPGSGTMVLDTDPMGTFVSKLSPHCIDPLPTGSPAGVTPIPPATVGGLLGTVYTFPVTGGSIAPDFSDGKLITGGGQLLTKNSSFPLNPNYPTSCTSAAPPIGTQIRSSDLEAQFGTSLLVSQTTLPGGSPITGPLGDLAFTNRTFNPGDQTITATSPVTLDALAASTLNLVLPNQSGNGANDFAGGDLIGTVSMTAKLR